LGGGVVEEEEYAWRKKKKCAEGQITKRFPAPALIYNCGRQNMQVAVTAPTSMVVAM
jgi:hypothetical protein